MLKNAKYPESREYRTGTKNKPYQFYLESLIHSNSANLLLGYFSSSAIKALSLGFAYFLHNGGVLRLVINQFVSDNDFNILQESESNYLNDYSEYLEDFELLKITLDEYGRHFFKCLAWLIANDRIQIVIVKPKQGRGIAHFKSGIFSDGENQVKFKASCNFTASGLLANLEELTVRLSWDSSRDEKAIEEQNEYFDTIFNKKADFVEYLDYDKLVINEIEKQYGNTSLDELLEESKALREKEGVFINDDVQSFIENIESQIKEDLENPKFPYPSGPRDYQQEAYENWVGNEKKGIFAMATGTGKTITSLNCLLNEYKESGSYQAVIIVPTIALVNQWESECQKFNFNDIIKVNSKNRKWANKVDKKLTNLNFGLDESFIIIITYASFSKERFQNYFDRFPKDIVLIADETHNIASPSVKKYLSNCKIEKRIGLSATPDRYYDLEGTKEMERFFSDSFPYTYLFSLKRAIEEEVLCKYYYYPKIVQLSEDEQNEYNNITAQIVKIYNQDTKESKKMLELLLLKRKRIIHKAVNKLDIFRKIVSNLKEENNINNTLIYSPEGFFEEDISIEENLYISNEDESRIINHYSSIVREVSPETTIGSYTSDTPNKEHLLQLFEKSKLDVLISMKCLDEGVDVPKTQNAIFCSSTGNPRQFIQRRGRILRKAKGKSFAYIYDLVVIPNSSRDSKSFLIEKNFLKKELERVVHFGFMAINKYETISLFEDICNKYELSLSSIKIELGL